MSNTYLRFRCGFYSRHLFVKRQDVRDRAQRRDSVRVDLSVTLGVVLLDVRELSRAAKRFVVPVKVAQPPRKEVLAFTK